jgi:signal transduction histidine kinase
MTPPRDEKELTGEIAHELNNLLHVIKNSLELITRRLDSVSPEVRGYIEMADRNADRAANLAHRLLALSRREPPDSGTGDSNKAAPPKDAA